MSAFNRSFFYEKVLLESCAKLNLQHLTSLFSINRQPTTWNLLAATTVDILDTPLIHTTETSSCANELPPPTSFGPSPSEPLFRERGSVGSTLCARLQIFELKGTFDRRLSIRLCMK